VAHHGSESYFVIGEGLLGETRGGRERTLAAALEAETPPFRFSRIRPGKSDKQLGIPNRKKIANAMVSGTRSVSQIPAGFTYVGQFVDHDLTFDRTIVTLGDNIAPIDLLQGRSPSLDLDSLYGAGPNDSESEKFYEADKQHLKMGSTAAVAGIPAKQGFDLPRGAGKKAVIPDERNDENLAVAQLHLAMIRFHNRVLDTLPADIPQGQRFARARQKVVKHYQWMLKTDYLPRICAPGVVNNVFNQNKRKIFEPNADPMTVPTMPVEFSVAAFRLGHSMIRDGYRWNREFPTDDDGTLALLFEFAGLNGNLGGLPRLPSNWIADFRRLFDFGEAPAAKPALVVPAEKFNRAMRIDTKLASTLADLPGLPADESNLAFRNLTRAFMVKLATGQQMATFVNGKGGNVTKLTNAQIRDGNNGADLSGLNASQRTLLLQRTPLWFYILREAEFNGGKLKGVGARIVVETFHRAMEGSNHSIVRDTNFKPSLGPNNQTFRMTDLLFFAFEGQKALLNPLGD
jgi:Animal haem peroxidase